MTTKPTSSSSHDWIWITAYADGNQHFDVATAVDLFAALQVNFLLGERLRAATKIDEGISVGSAGEWLEKSLAKQRSGQLPCEVLSLMNSSAVDSHWIFGLLTTPQYAHRGSWPSDPRIFLGVDCAYAKDTDSVRVFCAHASRVLIRDPRTWYGFINAAPTSHLHRPSFYAYGWWEGTQMWERFVEQCYWQDHALENRDRVRSIFWGNIFGPDFAKRLVDAGYWARVQWLKDDCGHEPVTMSEEKTGSMAVFLDDDPIGFAKERDTGFELASMARPVKTAGMLKDILSKARLL